MNTWYFGYANIDGLKELSEDPENMSTELFYDPAVKKEIGDKKKKEIWILANTAWKEKELKGVVFKVLLPDSEIDKIKELQVSDPQSAMAMINEVAVHIDLGIHGTTLEEATNFWYSVCGHKENITHAE